MLHTVYLHQRFKFNRSSRHVVMVKGSKLPVPLPYFLKKAFNFYKEIKTPIKADFHQGIKQQNFIQGQKEELLAADKVKIIESYLQ